jgi:glycosyltransferase involved in cell wall biosynthesis
MKIVVVNRNYFMTGGPERYLFSLMENMPQHRFIPFSVDFEQNRATPYRKYFIAPPSGSGSVYYREFRMSLIEKCCYAANSVYHMEAKRKLEELIIQERPDIALFLNAVFFSDSIIDACRSHQLPIIWRLSDYHKICANYLLYRDGGVCEECLKHGLVMAVRHRCGGYQRSFGASLVKVAGMWLSRVRRLYDHVRFFITPSAFAREKMIQGGFCSEKIVHIPTWTQVKTQETFRMICPKTVLYIGRISPEKGIETLIEAFRIIKRDHLRLIIAGDDTGSYAQALKGNIPDELHGRILFLGFQNQAQMDALFDNAACFVVPSVWYENQPNAVIEGMAHARAAVVSDLGSLKEMVAHGKTGYLFEPGNAKDLADKMDRLLNVPHRAFEMGLAAKRYVQEFHSRENHLASLDNLFGKCLGATKKGSA